MAEYDLMLKCLFDSEHDYREIKERRDALQALGSRTPEQDAEMADYTAKLLHDVQRTTDWIQQIGVMLGKTTLQTRLWLRTDPVAVAMRQDIMEARRQEALAEAAEFRARRAEVDAAEAEDIRQMIKARSEHLEQGILSVDELKDHLDQRRAQGPELETRAQVREARAARIAALKAAVTEWGS